jgi:hypothetical protein
VGSNSGFTTPRPEDAASPSLLERRMTWEQRNPGLMTRCPSLREERSEWDLVSRKTGERVAGPWSTAGEMLAELESRIAGGTS